jgi:hypothetical protein
VIRWLVQAPRLYVGGGHLWASPDLTDIRDQELVLRKDVHHGVHGHEEAAASSFVYARVQGRDRRAVSAVKDWFVFLARQGLELRGSPM